MAKEYIVRVKADTKEFEEGIKKVDKGVEGVSDTTEQATEAVDKFTNGAASAFKSGLSGARKMAAGMKTLKGAIASTGVGLLVVALGTLYTWMQTSEKGAKALAKAELFGQAFWKVITDGIDDFISNDLTAFFEDPIAGIQKFGTMIKTYVYDQVMNIINGLGLLGEAISLVFEGKFSEAGEKAKEGALMYAEGVAAFFPPTAIMVAELNMLVPLIEKAGEEMEKAAEKANNLAEIQFMLIESTKAYTVSSAQLQKTIDLEQKIIDDTTRSYEERIEALDRQSEALEAKAKLDLQQAKLQETALKRQIEITANYKESLALQQELADAQAERIEKEAAVTLVELDNAQKRREIDLEELERTKTINQAIEDARIENITNEREAIQERFRLEEERALQEFELLRATEEQKTALLTELKAKRDAELLALSEAEAEAQKTIDEKKVAQSKQLENQRISLAQNAFGAINAIGEAFAGADEARAKKAFQVSKLVGIAEATVNAYTGVTTALAGKGADGLLPFPIRLGNAVIAGATGLAQVAKIKSSSFGGSGGGGAPSISGGGGSAPSAPQTPTVDFGFLNQGANQTSVQAYVISNQVTNSQQSQQLIEDQAAL